MQLMNRLGPYPGDPRPAANRNRLPVFPFKAPPPDRPSPDEDGLAPRCSVCLLDYEDGVDLKALPCLHKYHVTCIDGWLEGNNTCPVCKHPVDEVSLNEDGDRRRQLSDESSSMEEECDCPNCRAARMQRLGHDDPFGLLGPRYPYMFSGDSSDEDSYGRFDSNNSDGSDDSDDFDASRASRLGGV